MPVNARHNPQFPAACHTLVGGLGGTCSGRPHPARSAPGKITAIGSRGRASCGRQSVIRIMTTLMLSWQQATLLALGCGVAGLALVQAAHVSKAWRWALYIGPFLREAGVVGGLYALWQLAGNLASGGFSPAVAHAQWIWDLERTLRLPSEL